MLRTPTRLLFVLFLGCIVCQPALAQTESWGGLAASDGRTIYDWELADLVTHHIGDVAGTDYESMILCFTDCYGDAKFDNFQWSDVALISGSTGSTTSEYGGFHRALAWHLKPASSLTAAYVAALALASPGDSPTENLEFLSGSPALTVGGTDGTRILVWAGDPGDEDRADIENIRENFFADDVMVLAGDGTGGPNELAATFENLKNALDAAGVWMNGNRQFILFVTDHGNRDEAALYTFAPYNSSVTVTLDAPFLYDVDDWSCRHTARLVLGNHLAVHPHIILSITINDEELDLSTLDTYPRRYYDGFNRMDFFSYDIGGTYLGPGANVVVITYGGGWMLDTIDYIVIDSGAIPRTRWHERHGMPAIELVDYLVGEPVSGNGALVEIFPAGLYPVAFDVSGSPADNGWTSHDMTGAGDFAQIWEGLQDNTTCKTNNSPQLAFIDDGTVVPGTGGSAGITWCYGPGGYIVNATGGLVGECAYLHNEVWSPVIDWPATGENGAILGFDVYAHERLVDNWPGMFYIWRVRSMSNLAGAEYWSEWRDRGYVYYGGPSYRRIEVDITDLLVQCREKVQVSLGVIHLGWAWGYNGADGSPAPYFDDVTVHAFDSPGPSIYARPIDLAQDNFAPGPGYDVPIDMARNVAMPEDMINQPGDDITVQIRPTQCGSALSGDPVMYFQVRTNPVFDSSYRTAMPSSPITGIRNPKATGVMVADLWTFHLPDTGFLFPGDVLHYYIEATNIMSGITRLPASISSYNIFPGDPGYKWSTAYPDLFTINALPSLKSLAVDDHPPILLWLDMLGSGNEDEWISATENLGYVPGTDFDVYYTNGASFGVGNGLGGRVSAPQLAGYETILYDCDDLHKFTLSNGDYDADPSDDIQLLIDWLMLGDKKLLLTGDHLAEDLNRSALGNVFLTDWIGVTYTSNDISPLVGGWQSPRVCSISGNVVFPACTQWRASHFCPDNNSFDVVETNSGTDRLAEFTDPDCIFGTHSFAAATLYRNQNGSSARVIYMPFSFTHITTLTSVEECECPKKSGEVIAERTLVLKHILDYFGHTGYSPPSDVPEREDFSVNCFPNPFNPQTVFSYVMPAEGKLKIRIFNLRGELVTTLLDETVAAGRGEVFWKGVNDAGARVASGTYFYEAGFGQEVIRAKVTLIK